MNGWFLTANVWFIMWTIDTWMDPVIIDNFATGIILLSIIFIPYIIMLCLAHTQNNQKEKEGE